MLKWEEARSPDLSWIQVQSVAGKVCCLLCLTAWWQVAPAASHQERAFLLTHLSLFFFTYLMLSWDAMDWKAAPVWAGVTGKILLWFRTHSVCIYQMCYLLSSFMSSFPELKTQNSGKQRLVFILKKFLDLSQYNPDTVSNPIELTNIGFPEPHPIIHLTYQWYSFPQKTRHCQCFQSRKVVWAQGSHQSHLTPAGISMDLCSHWTVLWMSQSPVLRENIVLCLLFPSLVWEIIHLNWWNLQTVAPTACRFSIHFPLIQLLCDNCKSQSDHAMPQIRAGVRLGCFQLPALHWEVRSRPGRLPEEQDLLGMAHGSARLAGERKVQKISPGWISGWWWFEHPEPDRSTGKPSYYPLVTKRACETDVKSHALQDADCSIDLSCHWTSCPPPHPAVHVFQTTITFVFYKIHCS